MVIIATSFEAEAEQAVAEDDAHESHSEAPQSPEEASKGRAGETQTAISGALRDGSRPHRRETGLQ